MISITEVVQGSRRQRLRDSLDVDSTKARNFQGLHPRRKSDTRPVSQTQF